MKKYIGTEKKNTAVFISGKGSNLKNLLLFSKKKNSPIKINLVVASTKGASGIKYAKKFGIKNLIYSPNSNLNKDKKFIKLLTKLNVKLICLAGYMKILNKYFIKNFNGIILNIHPSLLPKYKGLNTYSKVLKNKEKITGCTVHLVTEKLDSGKVILQGKVKIIKNDNIASLKSKVKKKEYEIYPKSIFKIKKFL